MGPSKSPPGSDARTFAEHWLREQQQLWQGFREAGDPSGTVRARQAWDAACERWWQGVSDTVPAPLAAQLKTALDQTCWWISVAGMPGEDVVAPSTATQAFSPERLLAAAADAVRDATSSSDPFQDPRYRAAFHAMVDLVIGAVQQSLERIRERLEAEGARTPREVHAIYSEEIEHQYLQVASSDAFLRAVGELVNAQVALMPARPGHGK